MNTCSRATIVPQGSQKQAHNPPSAHPPPLRKEAMELKLQNNFVKTDDCLMAITYKFKGLLNSKDF